MNYIFNLLIKFNSKHSALLFLSLLLLCSACQNTPTVNSLKVNTQEELNEAIANAIPGDEIILANGVWKDIQIQFSGTGTKESPIILKAETKGQVFIEGISNLKFGGEHLVVDGLYFKNGYTPTNAVIEFRVDSKNIASNCRVTNCVIEGFNQPKRDRGDLWVQFWGRHNQLDNCYLAGKTNRGPTVRIDLKGNESVYNYHKIINNHFGPRAPKGGPSAETIQLGDSGTSMSPSYTLVANNLFEACNGEVEVISSKSNFNEFKSNVFYKCEGSLVTRHGSYCKIDGNYFIGDANNENIGGIRLINTGHWVTNNYFYNLKGKSFRSPLAVMNGIPKSPLNRYLQVTDIVVAYNTYINCTSPWQFGVGVNIDQKDVLPASEIRSARPVRSTVANNLIYNEKGANNIIIEHDKADGVLFKNNIINNQGVDFVNDKNLLVSDFQLTKVSDDIFVPSEISVDTEPFIGFEFETISKDLFGNSRTNSKVVGAVSKTDNVVNPNILDKSKYGPDWFSNVIEAKEPETHIVAKVSDIQITINEARSGDIIALLAGIYKVNTPLVINKTITIQSQGDGKAHINFLGESNTPLFELNPGGKLIVKGLALKGNNTNNAFASLKENMSDHFGLSVLECDISDFNYVLKAYKESFAERITFKNTSISNCANGLELSEETNDKGDYNTEYLTVDNCNFTNVKANVIDYYRGGYDESTIGGNLLVTNSTFTDCGAKESNKILLNHRGIINVNLVGNTFKNNAVNLVSLLWGAKNNIHSNNTLLNSGEIKTEQNLKLKLMY
ncbi:chondroitinase-B domain-containing protein [Flavivirga aquimarina]|uniref:Chondroitinase-B domain-containing protein n=1 Tax=Flavivirga aquimarina TaxID=2027862 RepID=A0ABT8WB52_9FLAO|nr:chondroitinase-B domain-containing protein [Flavivirga aquimarina]MDO5970340.1 chondroitinase-B domain-containing protein [Flavivirga aquimarina]